MSSNRHEGPRLRGRPLALAPDIRDRILRERGEGRGWTAIARSLVKDGVPTAHGGVTWYPATVRAVVASHATHLMRVRRRRRAAR